MLLLSIHAPKYFVTLHLITNVLILSAYFLMAFAIGEIGYRFFKIQPEYTRKWSHISSGFLALLFPFMIDDWLYVALICSSFTVILVASKPLGLLPSINAVNRKTYGSILFPLAVLISFWAYKFSGNQLAFYFLPVLTLAISDMLAAIVGKRFPIIPISSFNETKSLGGYLAFVISSVLIFISMSLFGEKLSTSSILLIPPMVACVELYSPKGADNITIPLAVITGLYIFN